MVMEATTSPGHDGEFPFTEDEMAQAFSFAEDSTAARAHAQDAVRALARAPGWALGANTLLLLYVGSDTARAKIDALRERGVIEDAMDVAAWEARVTAFREDLQRRRPAPPGPA
jgi:hypothetical protein